ncbi:MAG TPA: dTDP-4-dehydrorhamnose 3,5-epimerase family protein [Magnetospirillaceae bacterium]|nr:dTDP-4-dehydrorhamnose 3,5-epimerase family protein [Magnetospirillaceae bacterium]
MAVPTTIVTGHPTDIPGLIWFDVTSVGDERGYFQEKYQRAKLIPAGLPDNFVVVQTSIAYNKDKGVIRGFHAEPWDKYISVVTGTIFVAYVDLRKGDTFGKVVTLEVDKDKAVFIPKGVGNSYQTTSQDVHYIYSVNQHWSEEVYKTATFVNLADPKIGVTWPVALGSSTMSDRDRNHPNLDGIKPMEF